MCECSSITSMIFIDERDVIQENKLVTIYSISRDTCRGPTVTKKYSIALEYAIEKWSSWRNISSCTRVFYAYVSRYSSSLWGKRPLSRQQVSIRLMMQHSGAMAWLDIDCHCVDRRHYINMKFILLHKNRNSGWLIYFVSSVFCFISTTNDKREPIKSAYLLPVRQCCNKKTHTYLI